MSAMASQITGVSIVCLTVCSDADQRKHQRSASLAFVSGIDRWPVESPRKGAVTRKIFPFDDIILCTNSNCDIEMFCKIAWMDTCDAKIHFNLPLHYTGMNGLTAAANKISFQYLKLIPVSLSYWEPHTIWLINSLWHKRGFGAWYHILVAGTCRGLLPECS